MKNVPPKKMYTLVLFLSAFAFKGVLSLSCYATDFTAMKAGNVQNTVQDCTENINKLMELQGRSVSLDQQDVPLRCYQVVAASADQKVAIKGCIPEGGCELMKPMFKLMLRGNSNVPELDCYECAGDRCNGASRKTLFGFALVAVLTFLIL